jgi:hypothetical protein
VPSASRHTRTERSAPPLTMTGLPSGRPDRYRSHCAYMTGEADPLVRGQVTVGPRSLPASI